MGGRVGPESGIFVLDVDGEVGRSALYDLERRGCQSPTLISGTGRGSHIWLKWPANGAVVRNSAGKSLPVWTCEALEATSSLHQSHSTGVEYRFVDEDTVIATAPKWLGSIGAADNR